VALGQKGDLNAAIEHFRAVILRSLPA
jgi:hypothetical protein